jgi:hypothetical protein
LLWTNALAYFASSLATKKTVFATLNPGLIQPSREFQRRKRLHQKKFQPPRKNPNLGRNPRLRKPSKPFLK